MDAEEVVEQVVVVEAEKGVVVEEEVEVRRGRERRGEMLRKPRHVTCMVAKTSGP